MNELDFTMVLLEQDLSRKKTSLDYARQYNKFANAQRQNKIRMDRNQSEITNLATNSFTDSKDPNKTRNLASEINHLGKRNKTLIKAKRSAANHLMGEERKEEGTKFNPNTNYILR